VPEADPDRDSPQKIYLRQNGIRNATQSTSPHPLPETFRPTFAHRKQLYNISQLVDEMRYQQTFNGFIYAFGVGDSKHAILDTAQCIQNKKSLTAAVKPTILYTRKSYAPRQDNNVIPTVAPRFSMSDFPIVLFLILIDLTGSGKSKMAACEYRQ